MHESCMSRPLSSAHHIHGHYMTQSTWSSTVVTLMDHTWSPLVWPFMATDSCFVPSLFTNHFYQKPTFNGFARLCVSGSPVSLIWLPCLMSARRPARIQRATVPVDAALVPVSQRNQHSFFRTHRPDLIVMEQQSRSTRAHSLCFLSFGLANSHGQCHLQLLMLWGSVRLVYKLTTAFALWVETLCAGRKEGSGRHAGKGEVRNCAVAE